MVIDLYIYIYLYVPGSVCVCVVLEREPILILRRQVLEYLKGEASSLQLIIKFFNNHKGYVFEERRTEDERERGRREESGK